MNAGITQPFSGHNVSLGYQSSKFTDLNKLSHDLNSSMMSLSAVINPSPVFSFSVSAVNSTTKDIVDSSQNKSGSYSGSFSYSMPARHMAVQCWATSGSGKNDSSISPSDTKSMTTNGELTWAKSEQSTLTFGVGRNNITDNIYIARTYSELTAMIRYGYSF